MESFSRTFLYERTTSKAIILLEQLPAFNAVVKYLILLRIWGISCDYVEHRRDSVCYLANIVTKAVDIGLDHILCGWDYLVCLALDAHQRWQLSQVIDEDFVVC